MDIYYSDLIPETQQAVLETLGIKTPEEGNWDTFPLFVLEPPESLVDEEEDGKS
ncbi:hypothetical protein LCGC14_1214290 [marine sediment metagenome]|uniref:Uncharacterized protein n=1 Tax=marine sediment metagenome TaxID=412755 RepID=A0A0F9PHU6_9ZZZZ